MLWVRVDLGLIRRGLFNVVVWERMIDFLVIYIFLVFNLYCEFFGLFKLGVSGNVYFFKIFLVILLKVFVFFIFFMYLLLLV